MDQVNSLIPQAKNNISFTRVRAEDLKMVMFREPPIMIVGVAQAQINEKKAFTLVYRCQGQSKNKHMVINEDLYLMLKMIFDELTTEEYEGNVYEMPIFRA